MRFTAFTILFLSFLSLGLSARVKPGNISGKVQDAQGKALEAVNVVVLKAADNTLVKADLTDNAGTYHMDALQDGRYIVKATLIGYQPYTSDTLNIAGDLTMPLIKMNPVTGKLDEVTVRTQKPFIEVKADKIVVNVENSIVNTGSTALEVLARSPGVTVDQNDNISLKGKKGVNIMIDGKMVPVSGADLANILKSMPSSNIEKIELISNPGSKYDAAGMAGIINIKTKHDKRMGMNGTVTAGYGQGVYPKANSGFSLNYRSKKVNVYANYNFMYRKGFNGLMLDRKFLDANGNVDTQYKQQNNLLLPTRSHNASVGVDYYVSPKTTIGMVMNGGYTAYEPSGTSFSDVYDRNGVKTSSFVTINDSWEKWYNYSANLNLRHTFDSAGTELTVDADYVNYTHHTGQDFRNLFYDVNGNDMQDPYILKGSPIGLLQIRSFKTDFSHPMKNNMNFGAGLKTSLVTADNDAQYQIYDFPSAGYVHDPSKSNHFIYSENINAAYVNFSQERTKWGYQLGLRAEQTNSNGHELVTDSAFKRNYIQLFPSLAAQYHLNEKNDVGLTLSRRIDRPNYDQLNPFKFFLDPSNYKVGNPKLKPSLTYAMELSHTYKQKFVTTLSYSITNDVITETIQRSDAEKNESIQTNQNLKRQTFVGLSIAYPFQFTKWWSNVTSGNGYYNYFDGNVSNSVLKSGKPGFDLYTTNNFLMPKDFSAELSLYFQSGILYGYMTLKPLWSLSAGVQKNLFKKTATIKLNLTDAFWKVNPVGLTAFSNYHETFVVKRDTRVVNIAFTYRFGNRNVGPARRRNGGAEDEKRRASGGQGA